MAQKTDLLSDLEGVRTVLERALEDLQHDGRCTCWRCDGEPFECSCGLEAAADTLRALALQVPEWRREIAVLHRRLDERAAELALPGKTIMDAAMTEHADRASDPLFRALQLAFEKLPRTPSYSTVLDTALDSPSQQGGDQGERGSITISRAVLFACFRAVYEGRKLLDTRECPLGPAADEARRCLRRAYVALERPDMPEMEREYGWEASLPDRDGARGEFYLWKKDRAQDIAKADFDHLAVPPSISLSVEEESGVADDAQHFWLSGVLHSAKSGSFLRAELSPETILGQTKGVFDIRRVDGKWCRVSVGALHDSQPRRAAISPGSQTEESKHG